MLKFIHQNKCPCFNEAKTLLVLKLGYFLIQLRRQFERAPCQGGNCFQNQSPHCCDYSWWEICSRYWITPAVLLLKEIPVKLAHRCET